MWTEPQGFSAVLYQYRLAFAPDFCALDWEAMKRQKHGFAGGLLLLLWMAAPAAGSAIDVTGASGVTLARGDELLFSFGIGNFGRYAGGAGPSRIGFSFAAVLSDHLMTSFSAALESGGGSFQLAFDSPVSMQPGAMRGGRYNGSVALWRSSIDLDGDAVDQLFGAEKDRAAYLVLQNLGDEITLGLPGSTISQSMTIVEGKGGLSVGTPIDAVYLEKRPEILAKIEGRNAPLGTETPEPELLLPVGIGVSALLGLRLRKSGRSA